MGEIRSGEGTPDRLVGFACTGSEGCVGPWSGWGYNAPRMFCFRSSDRSGFDHHGSFRLQEFVPKPYRERPRKSPTARSSRNWSEEEDLDIVLGEVLGGGDAFDGESTQVPSPH